MSASSGGGPPLEKLLTLVRSALAGALATLADVATLALLVHFARVSPHAANVPALLVGGVVNFVGNRHFAFEGAREGHLGKQALGYTVVEVCALVLNGLLFDGALRFVPALGPGYLAVRLVTSHVVFLGFSYPLWRRVFRAKRAPA